MSCEVVKNWANHKEFYYCRTHKKECKEKGCKEEDKKKDYGGASYSTSSPIVSYDVEYFKQIYPPQYPSNTPIDCRNCKSLRDMDLKVAIARTYLKGYFVILLPIVGTPIGLRGYSMYDGIPVQYV